MNPVIAALVTIGCGVGSADSGADSARAPTVWTDVAVGKYHICGIRDDGAVRCSRYGEPQYPDDPTARSSPGPYSGVVLDHSLTDAADEACATLVSGGAECWGEADIESELPFQQVSAEHNELCGVLPDATLNCIGSYGNPGLWPELSNVLTFDTVVNRLAVVSTDNRLDVRMNTEDPVEPTPAGEWVSVAIGNELDGIFCGVHPDGTISCWDQYYPGDHPAVPDGVPAGTFSDVCLTQDDQACALDAEGNATCWGATPMDPPDEAFTKLACGAWSVCGLTPDGRILCWGDCAYGECDVPE